MLVLSTSNLSLSYGTTSILDGITFGLDETDKCGIIGVNGCGKSTLLNLLSGRVEPTEGSVFVSKNKTIGFLTQTGAFSFDKENVTVLERMYSSFSDLLQMEEKIRELESKLHTGDEKVILEYTQLNEKYQSNGGLEFRSRCVSILQKLGFPQEMHSLSVCKLSGGQKTRLALAIELSKEPDILLLDEPTNHLDMTSLLWLEEYLASYKKCVIIVSHDRYFLDHVTNKTLAIEYHKAKLYNGGYTATIEQREIDKEIAERHWKNQQKEIARQEAYIAQQRAWNRERNIVAAESRQKMLDKMEKLERPQDAPKAIHMSFAESAISTGNDVLKLRNISMSFGEKKLFTHINFLLKKNDFAFIIGPNGCGKSTLIKILLKKLQPTTGIVEEGYNLKIGYYDQENQNLTPENLVIDELWNMYTNKTETEIRTTLAAFRFIGEDVFKPVSVLSGGERARLTMAKLILSEVNFLILDEPTNHLDIDSCEVLEKALSTFHGTVLTVSHDRYFIEKLATRIFEFHKENEDMTLSDFHVDHKGNAFTEYQQYKEARQVSLYPTPSDRKDVSTSTNKEQYLKNKQQAADNRKEKALIERLKKEMQTIEERLSDIEQELFGSAATDYKKASELEDEKEKLELRLMEIYETLEQKNVEI